MNSCLSFVLEKSVSVVRLGLAIMMIVGCFSPVYAARKKSATPKVVVVAAVKEPKRVVAAPRVKDASAKRSKKAVVAALVQDESAQQFEATVVVASVKDAAAPVLTVAPYEFNNALLLPILSSLNQLDLAASLLDGTLSYTDCLVVLQNRLPQANVSSYTKDAFSPYVKRWQHMLVWNGFLNPNNVIKVCVVGAFEGQSASWMIQNFLLNDDSRIYCIDTFDGSMDYFSHNIYVARGQQKCVPFKGLSCDVLKNMAAGYVNQFDCMYIGGLTAAADVYNAAVLSFPLVKSGGLIFFDDYKSNANEDPALCPKLGVDNFIAQYKNQVKVVGAGYQMYLQKL